MLGRAVQLALPPGDAATLVGGNATLMPQSGVQQQSLVQQHCSPCQVTHPAR